MKAKNKSEILEGANKEVLSSKFVDRNTLRVEYKDGSSAIRLHNTDVVTFLKNGNVVLNSGGYRTPTTKDRINSFSGLPFQIHQHKGLWSINGNEFYDEMILDKKAKLVSKIKKSNVKKIDQIKTQITKFTNLITKENLPTPDSGDCWCCLLQDKKGKTMGDHSGHSHLEQHMKEKYVVGSLLVNAMREYGYNDQQIRAHYGIKVVGTFRRAVKRYMQKRLIPNIAVR